MSSIINKPYFPARVFGVLTLCTIEGIVTPAHANHDTDADGVTEETEASFGTSPTKKDSDGDGINDNVELTPPGGGAFTFVNSDSDSVIDALDNDSDNDCVPDLNEPYSYRKPNMPNSPASLNCPAGTPVCLATNGLCVKCTTNFGGGTTGCPTATKPACNVGGALDGQCT